MEQDISKFIKEIREKHNLTQKDLANKYNVTYQAVSKWENGKNMPDMVLIKQMSKDFNVSLDNIFDGKYKTIENKKKYIYIAVILTLLALTLITIFLVNNNNSFKFKTLSSNCSNFNISGSIAYNRKKSVIYINSIKYCGGNDSEKYKKIECNLYETKENIENKIGTNTYEEEPPITLEKFLESLTFNINNYSSICKEYDENNLFLEINATNKENKTITYKILLSMNNECT